MNGKKGIPDTIYLQMYGDSGEVGNEDEIRSSDVTWSEKRIYPTDVEYRKVQSTWISVEELLPQPLDEVLLYDRNSCCHYKVGWLRGKKGDNKSKWVLTNGYVDDDDITHWMPIPSFDGILEDNKDVLKRLKEKGDK